MQNLWRQGSRGRLSKIVEDVGQFGAVSASAKNSLVLSSGLRSQRTSLQNHSSFENALVLCILVLSTTAFVNLFPGQLGIESEEGGEIFAQVLWALLYLTLFFLIRKRWKDFIKLAERDRLLWVLTAWAILSIIWSIDRPVTFRRSVALLGTEAFGVYFALRYSLKEQLEKITAALAIVIGASVFACLFFPSYALSSGVPAEQGSWRGVLSHKNTLGGFALLLALVLFIRYVSGWRRTLCTFGIAILVVVVVLSQSITSLVYFVLAFVAIPLVRFFQQRPSHRTKVLLAGAMIFAASATWLYFHGEDFVYSIGKDPTLTGRTELWALSLIWIQQKPVLGYGLEAFWSSYYGPAADFRIISPWLAAPHAHNAYVNLWLDLGIVGLLLLLYILIANIRNAAHLATRSRAAVDTWPIVFFVYLSAFCMTGGGFV